MTRPPHRSRVVCIGVATQDYIAAARDLPGPDGRVLADDLVEAGGGPAATAAVALARLGVPVSFIGNVGEDELGRRIANDLTCEGVETSLMGRIAGARSPSSVIVVHRPTAQRSIVTFPGSCGPPELTAEALEACANASWIHLDQAGYLVLAALRKAGVQTPVSLDGGNPIPALNLSAVTLYVPTETALRRVFGDDSLSNLIEAALDCGPSTIVVTRGAGGSAAATRDSSSPEGIRVDAVAAVAAEPMVSTLGAGDVFHGALLAGMLERELPEALHFANAAAALSCRALDGRSAIPSREELDRFLACVSR
ncbi:MAG: carbohydrate kinase family protein [Bryobacteraceae bacterium]